ncbi:MAG: UvrD-helicase domain-containing protein [Candidatus Woesearchaeota archaeon]
MSNINNQIQFDSQGNLIVPAHLKRIEQEPKKSTTSTKETEYIWILKTLQELPFPVGKNLLIDVITGSTKNETITRCKLDKLETFGCLGYTREELDGLISKLMINKLIVQVPSQKNKFWKILEITEDGEKEIDNPTLNQKKEYGITAQTIITEKERKAFEGFGSLLEKYNDYQKKAIISNASKILCIAGAGSGKTTVLTKRIEFLIKYKLVPPQEILAITFTRKARTEMEKRLTNNDIHGVTIQTFNSFCERILQRHASEIYEKPMSVMSYKDKILLINQALSKIGTTMQSAITTYFTPAQRRSKTNEQLINIFRSDCFFIRDYLTCKNQTPEELSLTSLDQKHIRSATLIFKICSILNEEMKKRGLRDFADQLMDTIAFFKENKTRIPKYSHILVDEFQDVNATQIELLDLLKPENLFCVGDPRQSIFGWRGSNIHYILDFPEKYKNAEVINLTTNYRSNKHIIKFINKAIEPMNLPSLKAHFEGEKDIQLIHFRKEHSEFSFVVDTINKSSIPRGEIFILARTNKLLNRMSEFLSENNIPHNVRSEEINNYETSTEHQTVTLATVHAIKGLEAEMVFVISANTNSFPCKGNEHPIVELIKIDEYDKEEEERRLLYVALSRAKKSLYITYTGSLSYFITSEMSNMCQADTKINKKIPSVSENNALTRLRKWRYDISKKEGIPAYLIMHNTTLEAIALHKPMTMEDLATIPGLGPQKIQRYGEEILHTIL